MLGVAGWKIAVHKHCSSGIVRSLLHVQTKTEPFCPPFINVRPRSHAMQMVIHTHSYPIGITSCNGLLFEVFDILILMTGQH